jgi:hypothetical protein
MQPPGTLLRSNRRAIIFLRGSRFRDGRAHPAHALAGFATDMAAHPEWLPSLCAGLSSLPCTAFGVERLLSRRDTQSSHVAGSVATRVTIAHHHLTARNAGIPKRHDRRFHMTSRASVCRWLFLKDGFSKRKKLRFSELVTAVLLQIEVPPEPQAQTEFRRRFAAFAAIRGNHG